MRIRALSLCSLVARPQWVFHHSSTFARHSQNSRSIFRTLNVLTLHQRRQFSSSPDDEVLPEGFQEILSTLTKVRDHKDLFKKYKQLDVFAPSSMNWLANWLMFYHLNRPQKTQLDLVEFIQGAKYAMKVTMMAMYSREFSDYVARESEAPGPLKPDCEAAELVQRSLETMSYEAFKEFLLRSASAGVRVEMKDIEMISAHLLSVKYERVAMRPTTNSSGAIVLGQPMHERLKLAVLFDITEHVRVTTSDGVEEIAVRVNKAIWQFESNVTTLEDIDWVVEPLHSHSSK